MFLDLEILKINFLNIELNSSVCNSKIDFIPKIDKMSAQ